MAETVILIGLGANLPNPTWGEPRATLAAALNRLAARGVVTLKRSRWYSSAPIPISDQPWYVNAVAEVATALEPDRLLDELLVTEREFGRRRRVPLAPRVVDLDLLAYGDRILGAAGRGSGLVLPHPRLHERAFVLRPLREVAREWRHPVLGRSVAEMIADLDPGQIAFAITESLEAGGNGAP